MTRTAKTATGYEYLSFGDALFLYLEREGTPLNIASLAIFEGEISKTDLSRFVASKLPQIPRYFQRVVVPPFNVGMPHWEFAPDFNLKNHIREVRLKRGTVAELRAVTASVLSPVMDRRQPLWDMTLIHGLKGRRTGFIVRIHHCLADGISGLGLLNLLMDASAEVPVLKERRLRVPKNPVRAPGAALIDTAMQTWSFGIERLLQAGSEVLTLAQRATGAVENGTAVEEDIERPATVKQTDMMRLATELTGIPARLPFNVVCHGPQRFEWTETPLADLKAIRNTCHTTVNDVILAIVTGAFQRYSKLHGVNLRGRSLRIIVPVSTRRRHNSGDLGNHITFAPFSAPLGLRSPKKLLSVVHDRMEFVKTAHVADFVSFAGTLLGAIPTPFQAVLAPLLSELPISVCNTICTNVPGPKKPLYLMGHKMLSAFPYVPIGGEMGVNCAVLSYNETVYFGFTADVHAVPDSEMFPKFIKESIAELKAAVGVGRVRTARKGRVRPARAVPEAPQEPAPVVDTSSERRIEVAPEEAKALAMTMSAGQGIAA